MAPGTRHLALRTRHTALFAVLMWAVLLGASARAFAQPEDVLSEVREGWRAAYVGLDAEGVASFFADDAKIFPPGQETVEGKEEVLAYFEERTAHPFTLEFVNPSSRVSGELGFDESDYIYGWVDETGREQHRTGRYLMIYRKTLDGRWLVTHDIWNDDKTEE